MARTRLPTYARSKQSPASSTMAARATRPAPTPRPCRWRRQTPHRGTATAPPRRHHPVATDRGIWVLCGIRSLWWRLRTRRWQTHSCTQGLLSACTLGHLLTFASDRISRLGSKGGWLKAHVFVKDPGIIGQGLHRHASNADHVGSLEDAQRRSRTSDLRKPCPWRLLSTPSRPRTTTGAEMAQARPLINAPMGLGFASFCAGAR